MKHLDRYILSQFFKNGVTLVFGFVALYLLIDFFEKIDNFMDKGKPMGLALKYFTLNIPFIIEQIGPVCILLAGVITLGLLNHSRELIALKACGIPLRRIVAPLVIAGMIFSAVLLTMSQFVLPSTMAVTNKIWNEEVRGRIPLGIFRNGRYYYRSKEGFYSFARPDPKKNIFLNFSYSDWDENYRLTELVAANLALWNDDIWTLMHGQVQKAAGPDSFPTEIFHLRRFDFPHQPADFFVPQYRSMELSLTGLFLEARRDQTREEESRAWAEFYGRLFYILLGLPLLLLGLPLLLIVYRKWGRDLSLAIPVSCGLAFSCWGLWVTLQSFAKTGYINPLLAATSVHIVIGAIGLFLLLREDL
ncbi:MAG: LptF/LptG family permease [Desulfobulbaceae bacterium]